MREATLALTGTGSIATSSEMLANGKFDISATTAGASIVTLSGSGSVALGSKFLTLTAAAAGSGGRADRPSSAGRRSEERLGLR